jgi:hypothetical protein
MLRRTLKYIDGVKFDEVLYLPYLKGFVVLRIKSRLEE